MMLESRGGFGETVLSVEGLTLSLGKDEDTAPLVDDVSFQVRAGETLGLVGESGSGKTLTLMSIPRLVPDSIRATSGVVSFAGTDLLRATPQELEAIRGAQIGVVFQEPMASLNPTFTVGDQVAAVCRRHLGLSRKDAWKRAVETLDLVGIPGAERRAKAYPYEFSGGMSQRVVIAMAIACRPRLLLADEPTTALDVTVQAQILELFNEMQRDFEMAMVFVSHDLAVVSEVADKVAVMYSGEIVEQGPVADVVESPDHPYTAGLLAADPQVANEKRELYVIPGSPPSPDERLPGCRFADRCGHTQQICRTAAGAAVVPTRHGTARCVRTAELVLEGVPSV